ncbi:MAG: PAS domain-containing sensor histidine kinase, partial [Desulfuromonadales bacterium]
MKNETHNSSGTEGALLESQQRYERMANTIPVMLYDSIISSDRTSRFLYVAPDPCREILELDPDALLKDMSLIWNIVHPDDLSRFHQEDVVANQAGKEFLSEVRIITPSGHLKWLLVNSKPNPSEPGKPVVWSGYLQDITARKQAEERLYETEQRLRLIVENSTNLFYMHTIDHVLTYISPQSLLFFDCEPEEAMVRWTEFLSDNPVNSKAVRTTQRAIDTGKRQPPYQIECIGKKGRKIWVEVHEVPIVENGRTVAISGTLVDITKRKQAQTEREQYFNFFQTSTDLMCIANPHGRFIKANPAFTETLGYMESELIAKEYIDFIHPDDKQATLDEIEKQRQIGFTNKFENRYLCKDGRVKWLSWRVAYSREENVAYATARDITEKKQSEETLQKSLRLLHTILENVPIRVFWKDIDLNYLGCNTAFAHSAGYSRPEDLLGKNDFQMCWLEQAEFYRADDKRVMDSRTPKFSIEKQQTTPDGQTIWVRTSKVPLFDTEKNIIGLLGIDEDITERKHAEEALRESEFFFKESQRLACIGSYKADLIAGYWSSSEVLDEIFGIGPDYDRSIQGWFARVHPDDREMMEHYLNEEVIAQRKAFDREYRIIRDNDGEERWVSGLGALKTEANGRGLLLMGTIQDITEQKKREHAEAKLEAQLHLTQRIESIGQLAGGVAHDFNNMLGVILGHADLALRKAGPSSALVLDLQQISKAAQSSADLTRQLLTFARKQVIAPKVLDLNEAVAGTLKMLQRLIGENIRLSWNPAASLWPVKLDPSQLDQILTNLCVNGRDAIAGIGKISIKTENRTLDESATNALPYNVVPGDYVLISVSDDGCGMDKETQSHIFEPFYTTKDVGYGTG